MIPLRFICDQIQGGINLPQKQPRPIIAGHQIGMFTLPANTRQRGQRLFHHRGGIDKDLNIPAILTNDPACHLLQAFFDQIVIITVAGIAGDIGKVRLLQHRHWVFFRPIIHRQNNHAAHIGPQPFGRPPPVQMITHPSHIPILPAVHKGLQPPLLPLAHRGGPKPHSLKPGLQRLGADSLFYFI